MPFDREKSGATDEIVQKDGVGSRAEIVTPGAADFDKYAKVIEVVGSGDFTYLPSKNADADLITVTGAPVGYRTPVNVRRVTSATATLIKVFD